MLGPVFQQELMLANRRGRRVLFRRLYTGWLLLHFVLLLFVHFVEVTVFWNAGVPVAPFSSRAEPVFRWLLMEQFLLVVLATPAFTAGAITDEKIRGTLQYLLTAGLTSWEILIGKLFGRGAHVTMLALAAFPLLCFLGVFAGAGPGLLLLFFAALVTPLLAAGAAGLLASVWCRTTRDAVLAVYLAGAAGFALLWLIDGLHWFDPFAVFASAGEPETDGLFLPLLRSSVLWGGVGLACLGLASWRLRGAYLRQMESSRPRQTGRWWRAVRPPVGDQPLTWKERWIDGLAPLAPLRTIPRWLGMTVVFVLTLAAFAVALWEVRLPKVTLADLLRSIAAFDLIGLQEQFSGADQAVRWPNLAMMFVASLLVGARASSAVTSERERQTWEPLLLSPLTARELLRGKLWGIIGATYPYLAAYALAAVPLSLAGGFGALVLTVGALVAAWLSMWVLGSAGLWCSVTSRSSWRSLLSTLIFGYLTVGFAYGVFMFLVSILFGLIFVALSVFDLWRGTALARVFVGFQGEFFLMSYVALFGVFLVLPWWFLREGQKHIAYRERVRRWPQKWRWKRGRSQADTVSPS